MPHKIKWPEGKQFAFSVFDDPDSQTLKNGVEVYALLRDLGFRTTKGVWPIRGKGIPSDPGQTCGEPPYLDWVKGLQTEGFEIGFHNATSHTSERAETIRGLDAFRDHFGHHPRSMANHYFCDEDIYWGDDRVTGVNRLFYNVLTLGKNRQKFNGHREGHPQFWGDLCRDRIKYVRNFVFDDINTLRVCPQMPYHDPSRPFVNYWFGSSEGATGKSFMRQVNEGNQERLEDEGGACIMYTHFGLGFVEDGKLSRTFRSLMERLSRRNGWFAPVSDILDHLIKETGGSTVTPRERNRLERRWLRHKLRVGSA